MEHAARMHGFIFGLHLTREFDARGLINYYSDYYCWISKTFHAVVGALAVCSGDVGLCPSGGGLGP